MNSDQHYPIHASKYLFIYYWSRQTIKFALISTHIHISDATGPHIESFYILVMLTLTFQMDDLITGFTALPYISEYRWI
jgi:hypothetical protein